MRLDLSSNREAKKAHFQAPSESYPIDKTLIKKAIAVSNGYCVKREKASHNDMPTKRTLLIDVSRFVTGNLLVAYHSEAVVESDFDETQNLRWLRRRSRDDVTNTKPLAYEPSDETKIYRLFDISNSRLLGTEFATSL